MTLTSQGYCENSIRKALSSVLVSILTTYTAFKVEAIVLSLLYPEMLVGGGGGEKQEECAHTVLRIQSHSRQLKEFVQSLP